MRHTIGDRLDLDALSKLHKPTDRASLRVACVELARRGMLSRDIAIALELSEHAVRMLLEAPELHRHDQGE